MSELTPYLCVPDARAAIDWYAQVLGAEVVVEPILMPDGKVGHVELAANGAHWFMAEEFPEYDVAAPIPGRGAEVTLHLTVDDVDAVCERVLASGVKLDRGPEDLGEIGRIAVFRDPSGHRWYLNRRPNG